MAARSPSRSRPPLLVAITGASGAPYAVRLLEALVRAGQATWLIVSSHGWRLLATETDIADEQSLRRHVGPSRW
ncbi:MAG TPA: flavoprotein, partial [Gemmatimonadaceae bacterium]|nr:flavoprotein [Gemmatimonadaceae bacterium]